jgi:glycosyltransferase involved in cell wall biosynthesis
MVTRVALVHPYSWPHVRRGGERYLHDLAWYLTSRGVDVDVITGGRPGVERTPDGRVVHLRQLRRLAIGALSPTDTFGASALPWLVRHRYDVVHALTPTAALAGVTTGQRTVYTVLGHPTAASLSHRRHDARLFRTTLRRVSAPLALSDSAATNVAALTGVRPRVVPPGVRVDDFPLRDEPRTGPPRVLFPADADDPRKCLDVLLAAFAAVLDRHPEARLVLGGGGGTANAFATMSPAVRDRVRAATDDIGSGELTDVPARYAAATVTVLPSVDEAFGLVLVESLATGTPVVAMAAGGPAEIVTDDRIGRLAQPRDPQSLADAINAVIDVAAVPGTPRACAEHARRWDWKQSIGPLHETVYRSVARRWT